MLLPKRLKYPLIPFLLGIFNADVIADTHRVGCWIPGTNKIWHTNDPAHPGSTNFLNDGVTGILNGEDDGYHEKDDRCNNGGSIPCIVYWKIGTGSPHTLGDIRGYGELSEYSIDYCSIDDYIPALFTFTLVIFFFRNTNLRLINESKPNHRSL